MPLGGRAMSSNPLPFFMPKVSGSDLTPRQVKTSINFQIACNFHQRVMVKHPRLSNFHSNEELLHAALLEANHAVISYTPQPFTLYVGNKRYTPDCYVLENNVPIRVIEIKPFDEFGAVPEKALSSFFSQQCMQFVLISNEEINERKVEAQNWLEIVKRLVISEDVHTPVLENEIYSTLKEKPNVTLYDFIDLGDRERTAKKELCLFRLLHSGFIHASLGNSPLDLTTKFWL